MTEKFDTNWDVDNYYDETEPEHHWQLRRAFMIAHQDKFSEHYLVSLARAFTNIEFMGCSYPVAVMQRVSELSKDVARDYRESKKTKLQKTFVSATNAAESKVNRGNEGGNPPGKRSNINEINKFLYIFTLPNLI